MKLGDKCHELTADACVEEHRGDLVLEVQAIIDAILLIIDGCEVDGVLFNKNPLVLFNREAVDETQLSVVSTQLYIFHDLSS